jgi:hypothetical protein
MMKKVLCAALTLGALATAALAMTPVPAALADEATRATTASDVKADKPIRLSDANLDSVTAGAVRKGSGAHGKVFWGMGFNGLAGLGVVLTDLQRPDL